MNIMTEAHARARYEHDLQACIAHNVFSPARIGLGDVAAWRRRIARALGPAQGVDSYADILANELRYVHWRERRIRKAA